jgi:thioredoxin-like negative regulator of GroEL
MATCLLCPENDNEVPDAMMLEHAKIMHGDQLQAMDGAGRQALMQARRALGAYVSRYRETEEYRKLEASFDAKPLDANRIYKFAVQKSYAEGFDAAVHLLEHLIAGDTLMGDFR